MVPQEIIMTISKNSTLKLRLRLELYAQMAMSVDGRSPRKHVYCSCRGTVQNPAQYANMALKMDFSGYGKKIVLFRIQNSCTSVSLWGKFDICSNRRFLRFLN